MRPDASPELTNCRCAYTNGGAGVFAAANTRPPTCSRAGNSEPAAAVFTCVTRQLSYGLVCALALVLAKADGVVAQRLTVEVVGLRNAEGSIHVGFYDSAAQWKTERSNFQRHGAKTDVRDGRLTLTFDDVPAGHYGLAIVDDENDSGGIDWGLLLPKEGFGFSDYYHKGLFRPDFEDFDFELPAGEHVTVTVRVRYL